MAALDERATVLPTARGSVQLAKEGLGPPVLVAHGGPGGFDQALAWCRHLRDGGCEVIGLSRPGYLRTPLESGRRPEDQADLYSAALDALAIERAAIFGFSSGAASAVLFAARHPDRTTALLLDTPILLPFEPPISRFQRATFESPPFVWLSYQLATHRPALMARFLVGGVSQELSGAQRRAAAEWITSDRGRRSSMQEQFVSIAPRAYRAPGWTNDQINERDAPQLPFERVAAPTVIAHGTHDAIVPTEHAMTAANQIAGAELLLVDEGHHLLSLSRNYGAVAQRQLELVHG